MAREKKTTEAGEGQGRYLTATLVYGRRYRVFGKLFKKGVALEVTEHEATQLRRLKAIPPGPCPDELRRALPRFKFVRTAHKPVPPQAEVNPHRGTSAMQDEMLDAPAAAQA